MISGRTSLSILLTLLGGACVDRLTFDIGGPSGYPIVIDGFISDQPGPYKIVITRSFDIESKESLKVPISVKNLIISDDHGLSEHLSEVREGIYQTSATGIRGILGRVYKLNVELYDGRVYESIPDTIVAPGKVDSIYYDFKAEKTKEGATQYGFYFVFNASAGENSNYRFLWRFVGTFRQDTHPEWYTGGCFFLNGVCNFVPFCSGVRNVGSTRFPIFKRIAPCECCTCWYDLMNPVPILSDAQLLQVGRFIGVNAYYFPIHVWTFENKVHAEVDQMSLTKRSFDFWRAAKAQKDAVNSLFQPITGKIPGNFVQISGAQTPIDGLFFATSISSKSLYITYDDIPNKGTIVADTIIFKDSCLNMYGHSTTTRPSYWVD